MAFCFGEGRGFGPLVVFAIGHHQEKGITPAPSLQQGLPCPRPRALPSLQPQKLWQSLASSASPMLQPAVLRDAQHHPLGHHPDVSMKPPPGPRNLPHWGRQRAGRVLSTDPQDSCPPHCCYYPKILWLTSLLGQGTQYFRTTLEEGTSIQQIIEI